MSRINVRIANLILIVAAVALLAACSTNQPVGVQLEDTEITTKIKAKLTGDPEINPFKIDVDTNEGVVRLSGTVEKPMVRAEAEKLARNTEGVTRVINDIRIGEKSMGERLDDSAIVAKIKAKLTAEPNLNPLNVNVDSDDGVVTLMGRVETEASKAAAERLARNTSGVRSVVNRLEVGNLGSGDDR